MIQRKQTIYLFFSGLITLVLLFIPFGNLMVENTPCFEYNAFFVKTLQEEIVIMSTIGNTILLIITSTLSFITVFFFKKRKLQLRLISLNMLVVLITIFTISYIYPNFVFNRNVNLIETKLDFNYMIIFIFFSPIGLYVAKKAIAKDEAMVKNADRLR